MTPQPQSQPTLTTPCPGLKTELLGDSFVVPESLVNEEVWLCYFETNEEDPDKIPCSPHQLSRSWINGYDISDKHLVSYNRAAETVKQSQQKFGDKHGLTGVMISLKAEPGLSVIDVDDCLNPSSGEITDIADELLTDLDDQFWEVSPSSTGLHCFLRDPQGLDESIKQDDTLELYTTRGITYTGRVVEGASKTIQNSPGLLQAYQRMYNASPSQSNSSSSTGDTHHGQGGAPSSELKNGEVKKAISRNEHLDRKLEYEKHDELRGGGRDVLSGRTERVVEAMIEHDDSAQNLYCRGSDPEVWHSWTASGNESGGSRPDRSKAEYSLINKICWWGRTAEMFDFQLEQSEIETIFVSSDIARSPSKKRREYIPRSVYSAMHDDLND